MKDEKTGKTGLLDVLFRRDAHVHTIRGEHRGDVETHAEVRVEASAFVDGNVKASRLHVAGIVLGSIVAGELTLVSGGEIWGDVLAKRIQIEPGAMLSGWMVTLTEEDLPDLLSGDVDLAKWPAEERLEEAQARLLPSVSRSESGGEAASIHYALLRKMREEAGQALSAYHDLEQAFEERLQSAAGEAIARAKTLQEELSRTLERVSVLENRLESLRESSEQRAVQLDDSKTRVAELQELLEQRERTVDELRDRNETHLRDLAEAEQRNKRLREQLDKIAKYATSSAHRVESLENTLQATIQQAAEQEEALFHWQELAKTTQEQVTQLEEDLAETSQKLEKSQEEVQHLDQLRAELDEEREQAQMELAAQVAEAEKRTSVDMAQEMAPESEDATTTGEMDPEDQSQLQEQEDQILWYRTALAATQAQLEELRAEMEEKAALLDQVRAELKEQKELSEKWQGRVGRLSELLYQASQQITEKEEALEKFQAQSEEGAGKSMPFEDSALRHLLRERDMQLDALEAEIEQYRQDLEGQSQRLAESRAEMAEMRLHIQAAESRAEEQETARHEVQDRAARRIRESEEALEQVQAKEGGESRPTDEENREST